MSTELLIETRDLLRTAGLISSDKQFCELWLGKSECYMRSLRFTGTQPSADALATCAAQLARAATLMRQQGNTKAGMHLDELRVRCYAALDQTAMARLQRKGVCA